MVQTVQHEGEQAAFRQTNKTIDRMTIGTAAAQDGQERRASQKIAYYSDDEDEQVDHLTAANANTA